MLTFDVGSLTDWLMLLVALLAAGVGAWATLRAARRPGRFEIQVVAEAHIDGSRGFVKLNASNDGLQPVTILAIRLLLRDGEVLPICVRGTRDASHRVPGETSLRLGEGRAMVACLYPEKPEGRFPDEKLRVCLVFGGGRDVFVPVAAAGPLVEDDCSGLVLADDGSSSRPGS